MENMMQDTIREIRAITKAAKEGGVWAKVDADALGHLVTRLEIAYTAVSDEFVRLYTECAKSKQRCANLEKKLREMELEAAK